MALIKVYKGDKSITIPAGAYKHQYAPAGWSLDSHYHIQKSDEKSHMNENEEINQESEKDQETHEENDMDAEEDDILNEMEDLEEKPLSELTVPELRALAEYKGVDITGITSAKKLREAIKSTM